MEQRYCDFLVEYYHEGSWWGLTIKAASWEDAEARVRQLQYAKLLGESGGIVPVQFGWFARLWCWAANLRAKERV